MSLKESSTSGTHGRAAARGLAAIAAGLLTLAAPARSTAEGLTIPAGTSIDLILQDALSTRTAKVGDTFRAKLIPAICIDGQPALPEGTLVEGRVELVKSLREGALTGVIGVKFVRLQLPGAESHGIDAKLTSLRHDDRRRFVELAPKVSTGRKIDAVLIGKSTLGRASTLVGDDLAQGYSRSGLGASEVEIAAGTQVTMELDGPVTVPASVFVASADVRCIHVSPTTVTAAQRALREAKYYGGPDDGQLDAATRVAIVRFQLDHDQLATGDLDVETLRLLKLRP